MVLLFRIVNSDRSEIFKWMVDITSLVFAREHLYDILTLQQSGAPVAAGGLLLTAQSFAREFRKLLRIIGCLGDIKQLAPVLWRRCFYSNGCGFQTFLLWDQWWSLSCARFSEACTSTLLIHFLANYFTILHWTSLAISCFVNLFRTTINAIIDQIYVLIGFRINSWEVIHNLHLTIVGAAHRTRLIALGAMTSHVGAEAVNLLGLVPTKCP